MAECIALLRGINVGRAKRVPMAELRDVLESLGCSEVRTLLNTGNAVFQSPGGSTRELAATVEQAIQHRFGFPVPTLVHTAREFNSIISDNPLPQAVRDPSQFLAPGKSGKNGFVLCLMMSRFLMKIMKGYFLKYQEISNKNRL